MRIAARMAAQRGLGLFRAAEESSRSTVEAGQPPCASACAVEALPSSQTAEQPASREAAVQDEQLPRAVSATGFGGNSRTKKRGFPENACGFVEVIPGLHRHAKGGGSISISDH